MEEIIGQRKNITNNKPNIKTNINNLNKTKKSFGKSLFNKFIIQIVICLCIVGSLVIYKKYQTDSYTYNVNKYKWIINYTTTYNDIYNNVAGYINQKFGFNIPLKIKVENNEDIVNNIVDENVIIEEKNETDNIINESAVMVSTSYDNMKIMAEEIKNKYKFVLPTTGTVSCGFGNRSSNNKNISSFHLGIDIANNIGTDIISSCDGVVEEVSNNYVYGNYVKIVKDDLLIVYAHCSKTLVKRGDNISVGQKIALMGDTGNATGSHLHFEVRKNGLVINPEYIIKFR